MSRHTPGPWKIRRERDQVYVERHSGDRSSAVATLDVTDVGSREANARLIVAAPEMLTVLKRLVAWGSELGGWDAPCWADAEAVIAKAEGRST